jgi:hypothetical protein
MSTSSPVIAMGGRRVDAPDAKEARFPPSNEPLVARRVRRFLEQCGARALVSSGACGADLITQEAAAQLGLERRMVLPFEPSKFRNTSVTDRPGDWGPRFDAAVAGLSPDSLIILSSGDGDDDDAYARTNLAIFDTAAELAGRDAVEALIVWNGESRGDGDLTLAFAREAESRSLRVNEILTLDGAGRDA